MLGLFYFDNVGYQPRRPTSVSHINLEGIQIVLSNAAPKLWNELPMFIHQCESLAKFKHHLKTYVFKKAYL